MPKTVLLTGAAGFIGSHTAKALLEQGDTVIGIDSLNDYYSPQLKRDRLAWLKPFPGFTFYQQDITEEEGLGKIFDTHQITHLCHLAAYAGVRYSIQNPLAYINTNVVGSTLLFELAHQHEVKNVVFASSSSVYGKNPHAPFKEDDRTDHPLSVYAATKKSSEVIAHSYHHLHGLNMTGLRFFSVYGPWGRPDMAGYLFTSKILKGEPIDVFNNGHMKREFTYIDDIVRGVVSAVEHSHPYELINLGGSVVVELEDFISLIEDYLGKKAIKNYLPMQPGDIPLNSADTSKAKELLGWEPQVSLEEGVKRFCDWIREYVGV